MVTVDLKVRHFHEVNHVWGEDTSNMTTIPTQHLVTIHILKHWKPFQDLKLTFVVSCLPEKLRILTPRNIVDTEEDYLSSRQSSRIFRKRIRFHLPSSYHDVRINTIHDTHHTGRSLSFFFGPWNSFYTFHRLLVFFKYFKWTWSILSLMTS